jgi:5-methylcytosine-specific restriction enzyme subunit McrC
MRIEQAEERKEIDIPISEIVKDGGRLDIFPSVKKYFSIDYKPKSDKLSLVAGGFIGLIPINSELAIEIKPKFSISNLTRIVSIAEDRFNTLSFFRKKYGETSENNPVVFEFMAECLVNELQTLEEEGLLKDYFLKNEDSNTIRGRINVNASIKSLWSHGHFNKVSVSYFDFTPDNPFNQLIKLTIKFCIEELSLANSGKRFLRDSLIDFYSMFDAVSLDVRLQVYDKVFNAIKSDKVSILRGYYVNICEICRLIINQRGVDFDNGGDDVELNSFTLDMASIFEKYLLNSLRANRDTFPDEISILDGNKEGRKKLYNQPSIGIGDAKPDIILKQGDSYQVIADAKYKLKTKEADRYQVISHALSYGAKIAVLILPKDENYDGDTLVKLGGVGSTYKIDVYEYYFNLSSNNLVSEEKLLAEKLLSLSHDQ